MRPLARSSSTWPSSTSTTITTDVSKYVSHHAVHVKARRETVGRERCRHAEHERRAHAQRDQREHVQVTGHDRLPAR